MVACQWKRLSPMGPAEHEEGGSRPRSMSSCRVSGFSDVLRRVVRCPWDAATASIVRARMLTLLMRLRAMLVVFASGDGWRGGRKVRWQD